MFLFLATVSNPVFSQTTLTKGDLVFTRIQMDDDSFSFLVLTSLENGTVFYITDEAWNGSSLQTNESELKFTATSAIAPGEEISYNTALETLTFSSGNTLGNMVSVGINSPTNNMLGTAGDNLFIHQGTQGSPTVNDFITGISANAGSFGTPGDAWQSAASTSNSILPSSLTNGTNALGLYPDGVQSEVDNARYKPSALHSGDKSAILAAIMNISNWEYDNDIAFGISSTLFSVSIPCTDPDIPTITPSATTVCLGATATLNIVGNLNDATQWHIYTGSCGGTLVGSTNTSSFNVTPGSPSTTYYIRGEGGCITPSTCATVTINATSVSPFISSQTNISCNGGSDGSATASASGGTAPYSYLWSNSATTAAIAGVSAGNYTVTITDANGCATNTSATITEPAALVASTTINNNVSCNGGSDGSATASTSGGTAPYSYLWSNSATTATIAGVSAGNYTVTITDANGCATNTSATIAEPAALVASTTINNNVSCNGGSDGSATASASGGTAPYSYLWSNSATTAAIAGVSAGNYTVTITDANGCATNTSATITEPAALVASTTINNNVSCNGGSDGSATASASGGTAPYSYLWSNSATTATIAGVSAGNYTVTITDANGCATNTSATITEPAALVASTTINNNVSCNGGSDGSATASTSGGTAPYSYLWSNSATTATIAGVSAGNYTVTITDANGCATNTSATIAEPAALVASTTINNNVSCNGGSDGSATASASGGTAPYSYLWSNSATTAAIAGVSAGNYTVTITDANGCATNTSATITEPAALVASTTINNNVSCNGGSDGSATASASGGTAPYSYLWSNSATTATIAGVSAGNYTVTITDANGCAAITSATIAEPAALVASTTINNNVSCNGGSDGSATASASGGTAPYSYLWSNSATTATIAGVSAGNYTVTITDANGCATNTSATIAEPAALVASTTINNNVSCNGGSDGSATASASGGTAPYSYLWSNSATTAAIAGVSAGNYTVTITDANGCAAITSATIAEPAALVASTTINNNVSCNGGSDGSATASASGGTAPYSYLWSNSATTATIAGVSAGNYTVTITDANGCAAITSATIAEPAALVASTTINNNVSCNGGSDGSATASASGGTAPYSYLWSNSATTATIAGVSAGNYTVTITDANGCATNTSATIAEPAALVASTTINNNVSCNGGSDGSATASASGGTAPYSYLWSNSATTAAIAGVSAGNYTVTITDANGCAAITSATIAEPAALVASTTINNNVSCNGGSDGSATASASGGTAPYSYLWSNSATTATIAGVSAGNYTVTITDANGCATNTSATIAEPAALVASTTINNNVSCNGGSDGSATASASGGTAPYSYLWSNSATTATIAGVSAGNYTVTITDANGCASSSSESLTLINNLDDSVTQNVNMLTANQTGATYQWYECSNSDTLLIKETNQSYTATAKGNYKVKIILGGCQVESMCITVTTLSISNLEKNKFYFSMYPIPASNNLTIKSNLGDDFQIVNQLGQIVKIFKAKSDTEKTVYVGNLSEGMYFVRAANGVSKKLIITK
ncbi:T9SS type A sorting domain-containing protein [Pseudotamlana carrageenivorans]|uniref:T9SS type A sorting domain-containing protein n=1 Tax=Pseudotamlana carrageenivorans TaxID=2069432 RepID=UPI0013153C81|nr:T9SS type A sorting domain-containing protein [Tamlana carrageenivorans]